MTQPHPNLETDQTAAASVATLKTAAVKPLRDVLVTWAARTVVLAAMVWGLNKWAGPVPDWAWMAFGGWVIFDLCTTVSLRAMRGRRVEQVTKEVETWAAEDERNSDA
ncbi:hypothetical protein BFP70_06940 [Thioclava sp. SK-1]|uniref:hypothetical protein n=1 Tax=Thioclava sp. SK-1 TaxID=1889770 RepID=UPI000825C1ED|nr:hypothetical protein [Thioclava sp. SK-1]OCX65867.1 hypothetical protein BFP70_06940 [Thioclava sp. SK-1]